MLRPETQRTNKQAMVKGLLMLVILNSGDR